MTTLPRRHTPCVLDTGLPPKYSKDLYHAKVAAVFEHFYEGYPESGKGAYAQA